MKLNPLTLKFSGDSSKLEAPFLSDYYRVSLTHIRISLILGALLYSAFGILDALLMPEQKYTMWLIRFVIVCPIICGTFLLSFLKSFERYMQPLLSVLFILAGGGIMCMIVLAPPPVNYSYYAGLLLVFMWGYTFIRIFFLWASLAGWVQVLLYEVAAIWISPTPYAIMLGNNFFFISANVIGMLTCYSIEFYARRDFFLRQQVEIERENVNKVNQELEERVEKRTADYQIINRVLEREIIDRKKAEEALRKSEDKYRTLIETTDTGFVIIDQDGLVLDANPEYVRLAGRSVLSEIAGRSVIEWTADYEKEKNAAAVKACFEKGYIRNLEIDYVDSKGNVTPIEINATCMEIDGKIQTITICRDITQRKHAEATLRESEVKYRTILENIDNGYCEQDLSGNFTFLNDSMCRIYGYSKEELIGMHYKQYTDKESGQKCYQAYSNIYKTGEPGKVFDFDIIRKDGTKRHVESSVSLQKDAAGKPIAFRGIVRDVTERKLAEDALRQSEEKYRTILESIQEGYFELDLEGNYTFVNEANCKFLGYTKEELVGMSYKQHIDEENGKKLYQSYYALYKTGKSIETLEVESLRKDGTKVIYETSVSLIRDAEGKPIGFRGVSRDATERRQMEETIRHSEERHRTILDEMADGYFEVDLAANYTYINDAGCRNTGYSREELIGKSALNQIAKEDIKTVYKSYNNIYRTGNPERGICYQLVRKDGEKIFSETSAFPLINQKGEIIGFRGVARNITERKRAEEEKRTLEERLQRAEKMEALGTLAGGVAHDLNNVLGIIVGYAELLLNEVDKSSPIRPRLTNIMNGSEKAAAIVQDLLTLARRGVPVRQIINLKKLILDYQNSPELEKLFTYHSGVRIKFDLEPDLLNISGSSVHLGKVISNLVSNAVEAMPAGGDLTIKTSNQYLDKPVHGYDNIREGEYVVFSVTDTGEGIRSTDLQRIFEPFYTKKVMGRSGTGLGLAVVWGTVKDHQGYINVHSEEGKGSTFTIYFPVTREDVTSVPVSVSISEYIGRGETILVVDDVKEQRDLAAEMLKKLNYKVTSFSSGEVAIAYIKEHKFDLLVLDMIMDPGMDGLDTYRGVLKIRPKQKAIIVSGFSESERVNEAHALGAGAYLKKPYVIEKLGLAVRKELDRK